MDVMRISANLLLGILLCLVTAAHSLSAARPPYTEVFYPSGSLSIQAYLYKPFGSGPFPVIIYNHGARHGSERRMAPQRHIGRLLTGAGYVLLVPEFPLGVWKEGERRKFVFQVWGSRESERTESITIQKIDFVFQGSLHCLEFYWTATDRHGGRIYDRQTYVYCPGKSMVSQIQH